jgi:hypothetical protein
MEEEEFRAREAEEESKEIHAGEDKEAEHKGLTTLA